MQVLVLTGINTESRRDRGAITEEVSSFQTKLAEE